MYGLSLVMAYLAFGAAQAPPFIATEARPQRCDYIDDRSWEERSRNPRAGAILLPRFVSAMTRTQVEAINPLLVGTRPRGRIELIPGFVGRAMAVFSKKTDLLLYLHQEGGDGPRALKAARAYFGKPQEERPIRTFIAPWASLQAKWDEYRWCDQDRLVVLNINDGNYLLTIEPR